MTPAFLAVESSVKVRYRKGALTRREMRASPVMKCMQSVIGVCLLGLAFTPVRLHAQTEVKPPADAVPVDAATANALRQRVGRVIVPEKPGGGSLSQTAVRPRPGMDLPPEVKERVRTFDQYRNEYLRQQEELRKRNKGTTDQDRERIRAQLKELRERWREQSAALREELEERRRELPDLLPSHRELLDSARETIRDRRERRGVE